VIATLLQMQAGRLHPTRNLEKSYRPDTQLVNAQSIDHPIENAADLSMVGRANTALWLGVQ